MTPIEPTVNAADCLPGEILLRVISKPAIKSITTARLSVLWPVMFNLELQAVRH